MPSWSPDLAASGQPATIPVATWSSRCAGAERAGRNELRGMLASGGARREGQPRSVTTDQVISRTQTRPSPPGGTTTDDYGKTSSCPQAHGYVPPAPDPGGSHPVFSNPRLTWRQFIQEQ